jgi:hypothetical protein
MMALLPVLALIGFGLVAVSLLFAKPSRLRRLHHRYRQQSLQYPGETDYIHKLLLYKQHIQRAEAERDRITRENQRLQHHLAEVLAQLSGADQGHHAVLQDSELAQGNSQESQPIELIEPSADLLIQWRVLNQAIGDAEQTLHNLQQVIQDQELHRAIVDQESQELLAQCEKLVHSQEYLKQENLKLEEYHYRLMADEAVITRNASLEQENQQLKQIITNLKDDCEQYRNRLQEQYDHEANLNRISIVSPYYHQQKEQQIERFHVELDLNFSRVIDALDFAEYLFGDVLEIWDSARESAFMSNYVSPSNVYLNLQSLAWFGRDYFQNNGSLGVPISRYLSALKCTHSSESNAVKNNSKLRSLRNFRHGAKDKIMYDHLKLGNRGGDGSLRIYFAINDEIQRIEVGYCGRHLPVKQSS